MQRASGRTHTPTPGSLTVRPRIALSLRDDSFSHAIAELTRAAHAPRRAKLSRAHERTRRLGRALPGARRGGRGRRHGRHTAAAALCRRGYQQPAMQPGRRKGRLQAPRGLAWRVGALAGVHGRHDVYHRLGGRQRRLPPRHLGQRPHRCVECIYSPVPTSYASIASARGRGLCFSSAPSC